MEAPPRKSWLMGLSGAPPSVDAAREIRAVVGRLATVWSGTDLKAQGAKPMEANNEVEGAVDAGKVLQAKEALARAAKARQAPPLLAGALEPTTPSFGGFEAKAASSSSSGSPGAEELPMPRLLGHISNSSRPGHEPPKAESADADFGYPYPWQDALRPVIDTGKLRAGTVGTADSTEVMHCMGMRKGS
mmetsp:Transcript_61559/g.179915  ORF Transcript_61559/g.179915 Transcript_61559/m.179915 type:complete len:189 (+) Transcript_61559:61-627(+)